MHVKLITEHDCAVECNISCSLVEMLIINKALLKLSKDKETAEDDRKRAKQMVADFVIAKWVEVADEPQADLVKDSPNLAKDLVNADCAWK